jgi:hypothetical protein
MEFRILASFALPSLIMAQNEQTQGRHLAEPKKNGGVCLLNPHDVGIGSEIIKGDSKPERV